MKSTVDINAICQHCTVCANGGHIHQLIKYGVQLEDVASAARALLDVIDNLELDFDEIQILNKALDDALEEE